VGQIIVNKNAIGTVGLGLFLLGIGAFVYSAFDPAFGPIAIPCIVAGAIVAGFLLRRRPRHPQIDARQLDPSDGPPPPIEPR
jgi:CHASE2 domain-containing sensor protein